MLRPRWAAMLAAACLLNAAVGLSQDPAPPPSVEAAAPAGPDTTIWIDDAGRPRPVVGVTYDEFAKAWRLYQGVEQATSAPRYTLSRVDVQGRQENGHATLDVTLEIQSHTDQRVEAAIGFRGAVLDQTPDGLGPDDAFGYSSSAEAYTVALAGKGTRTVRLSLLAPIRTAGQTNELSVTLPRAVVSTMALQLTGRATDVSPLDDALLGVEQNADGARLTVQGGVGRLRLRWRSPDQQQAAAQTVLDAAGEITSLVDGGGVRSTARLTVRSFGGEFERFGVRLPPGAKLRYDEVDPSIARIEQDDDGPCTVVLPEKTAGPVTVVLTAELALGSQPGADARVDLAGFEVLGAVRQQGYHAVRVDEDTQLTWGDLRGARRVGVDELPAGLASGQADFAVRYFRRDSSIPVEVLPRETKILASPSYHLEILPDVARLHVTTRYQIMGAPVLDFSYRLNDWFRLTTDPIEPVEHIDTANRNMSDEGVLDIPLTRPQSGNLTVGFHCQKFTLTADGGAFDFELPQPLRPAPYTVDRRELRVTVDPSLRLTLAPESLAALEPVASPAGPPGADAPQEFLFRDDAFGVLPDRPMRLKGSLARRAGELRAMAGGAVGVVSVDAAATRVQQQFDLEVQKQPRDQITFLSSAPLPPDAELHFDLFVGDRSANDSAPATPYEQLNWKASAERGRVVVDLPRPWIGPLSLDAYVKIPAGYESLAEDASLSPPLLSPAGAGPLRHDITVRTPDAVLFRSGADPKQWRVAQSSTGGLELHGGGAPLRLVRAPVQTVLAPPTMVTRVWRQSWRRGDTLQQRSAWRVTTAADEVLLRLPPEVAAPTVLVRVDGELVTPTADADTLRVPLPAAAPGAPAEHTIEARRVDRLPGAAFGPFTLRPLALEADASQATCYWQVVAPSERWLMNSPESLRPAWTVGWRHGRLQRLPIKTSEELEDWSGATRQGLPIAQSERAYLFSALSVPSEPWRVQTIDQRLAALGVSTATLIIGLVVIYAPPRVRNITIGVVCGLLLLTGYWRPAELALAAQSGVIGLLALFAGWTAMLTLAPREKPTVELGDDSTSIRRSSSNHEDQISLTGGSVSTNAPTVSLETSNPLS